MKNARACIGVASGSFWPCFIHWLCQRPEEGQCGCIFRPARHHHLHIGRRIAEFPFCWKPLRTDRSSFFTVRTVRPATGYGAHRAGYLDRLSIRTADPRSGEFRRRVHRRLTNRYLHIDVDDVQLRTLYLRSGQLDVSLTNMVASTVISTFLLPGATYLGQPVSIVQPAGPGTPLSYRRPDRARSIGPPVRPARTRPGPGEFAFDTIQRATGPEREWSTSNQPG